MDWKEEAAYLKGLDSNWWKDHGMVILVAEILDRYGVFVDRKQVISFFEKPWTYQHEIDFLIEQEG